MLIALVLAACGTARPATEAGPFRDARAVAFDPAGRAYVVDGDLGLCRETRAGWACVAGSENVQLVDPMALDASDGLTVLVADRAGRILRLDREGVVRDALAPPSQASRAGEAPRFAPVAVVRDALGQALALDPLLGVVRWDAARQFTVVVAPERLPRGAQALVRDGDGFAVLGEADLARYDAFGTPLGRTPVPEGTFGIASNGATWFAVTRQGLRALESSPEPAASPAFAEAPRQPTGFALDERRICWLTRTNLDCKPASP